MGIGILVCDSYIEAGGGVDQLRLLSFMHCLLAVVICVLTFGWLQGLHGHNLVSCYLGRSLDGLREPDRDHSLAVRTSYNAARTISLSSGLKGTWE